MSPWKYCKSQSSQITNKIKLWNCIIFSSEIKHSFHQLFKNYPIENPTPQDYSVLTATLFWHPMLHLWADKKSNKNWTFEQEPCQNYFSLFLSCPATLTEGPEILNHTDWQLQAFDSEVLIRTRLLASRLKIKRT